ncbi:MAG: phosphatidylglycerophosphatase A [Planctomycetota bacterium]|nr:MAG: phosphatidylglycerophosphatase A [Planctomycetota bacterium]
MSERLRSGLAWTIATAGGAGCLRPMPGTWGSIWAAVIALAIVFWTPSSAWGAVFCALTLLSSFAGWWACPWAIRHYGRSDPSQVVIDEVAGLWLALALLALVLPSLMQTAAIGTIVIAFLWFRLFDVWKPWPISRLERLPGATGIMADDLAAGLAAALFTAFSLVAWMQWIPGAE